MGDITTELRLEEILREDRETTLVRERSAFDKLVEPRGQSVVLFGAGNLGRRVLSQLRRDGVEPLAFADNNSALHGTTVDGLTVLSPRVAASRHGQSAAFVVTIWRHDHSFVETQAALKTLGCVTVVSVAAFRWKHPGQFLPFLWAELPSKATEQAEAIRGVLPLWADEVSRREYLAQLQWRVWGDFSVLASPVQQESYFPDDLFSLRTDEQFVDCGAFDGITLRQFVGRLPSFTGCIIAVEPDPANYRNLEECVSTLGQPLARRVETCPVAVGATRCTVRFKATGDPGAAISENGALEVECFPLDDMFARRPVSPTYIKMDIEGAELDALKGAEHTIRTRAPVLAICSYHRFDDLWRIPAYIHSLRPDYSLFLRPHGLEGVQLVCYAIPQDRLKR